MITRREQLPVVHLDVLPPARLISPRFHRSIAPSVSTMNKVSTTIYLISQSLQFDAKNDVTFGLIFRVWLVMLQLWIVQQISFKLSRRTKLFQPFLYI